MPKVKVTPTGLSCRFQRIIRQVKRERKWYKVWHFSTIVYCSSAFPEKMDNELAWEVDAEKTWAWSSIEAGLLSGKKKTVYRCLCAWIRKKALKQNKNTKKSNWDDYDCNRGEQWKVRSVFSVCHWMWVRRTEGWDRWASQKDHLSCVRGSMERVGDSDEGWLLLSSPFKLFLHTGHVSCCGENGDNISFGQFSHKYITNIYSRPIFHNVVVVIWPSIWSVKYISAKLPYC